MTITADFSISATGDIRHVSGSTVYTVLELHQWLQDLADDAAYTSNDLVDILAPNPSKLDGPRDAAVASRLNLLTSGAIVFNLDDTAAQFINFGSIKQDSADVLFSGLKTIGSIVADSPVYVVQDESKITSFWADGHIQILVKVKEGGALIDSGNVTAFSRKWGQTYSHFDVNLAAGGENNAALATAVDPAIVLTEIQAAALSAKVTLTVGDVTEDILNGNGPKLYKGTISLTGGCTLQEAYQYLQYLTREDSADTVNSIEGWQYRKLNAAYTEIVTAPFGTFAGGTLFFAQGWFVEGVLAGESTKFELIAHDGTQQVPPAFISISVGNLVSGDRVLVARDDGFGEILKDEYTPDSGNTAGNNTLVLVEAIGSDTPASGVVRAKGKRYTYTSFSDKTFSGLSPVLQDTLVTEDEVFVPYIDTATNSTSETASFTYGSAFTARVDVRRGSGDSPIVPFTTTISVTSAGASVNASRISDV